MSAAITIKIRATVQVGSGRVDYAGRQVTARADEPAETVRNAVTAALREVNDELKGLIR